MNKIKKKKDILNNVDKAFDKIQNPFMIFKNNS